MCALPFAIAIAIVVIVVVIVVVVVVVVVVAVAVVVVVRNIIRGGYEWDVNVRFFWCGSWWGRSRS